MAQVVVKSDSDQSVLMCETVLPAHLDDEQSAVQLLERLAWAIEDCEAPQREARRRRRFDGRISTEALRLRLRR